MLLLRNKQELTQSNPSNLILRREVPFDGTTADIADASISQLS